MANNSLLKAKFSFITNGGKFITMGIDTKKVQYSNISLLPGGGTKPFTNNYRNSI